MVQPFDEDDVKEAIKSLPTCKASGLDSLPSEFYKAYIDDLAPQLLKFFADTYETGVLPPSLREGLIVTLLKPEKAANRCDSYKPLSLINLDTKIQAKMIESRLQPLVPMLVLPDQSGFVPKRSMVHNLPTIFAVLHHLDPEIPAVAVLLDAAKAFDSLHWGYVS